jgi:hypothetical protein
MLLTKAVFVSLGALAEFILTPGLSFIRLTDIETRISKRSLFHVLVEPMVNYLRWKGSHVST